MSIVAAIRRMRDAGLTEEQALIAAEAIEAEMVNPHDQAPRDEAKSRRDRNARYYEARKQRLKTSENVLKRLKPSENVLKASESVLKPSENVTEAPSRAEYNTTRAHAVIPVGITSVIPPISSPFGFPHEKKSTARRKTTIPETAQPTDRDRDAADRAGLAPDEFRDEWRAFRDHHLAKGSTMLDWPAAWRTWLRNRKRFAGARAGPAIAHEKSGVAKLLAEAFESDRREREKTAGHFADFRPLPIADGRDRDADHGDDGGLFG